MYFHIITAYNKTGRLELLGTLILLFCDVPKNIMLYVKMQIYFAIILKRLSALVGMLWLVPLAQNC